MHHVILFSSRRTSKLCIITILNNFATTAFSLLLHTMILQSFLISIVCVATIKL